MCENCSWKEMKRVGDELQFAENIQGYYITYDIKRQRWWLTDACGIEYVRIRIHNCPWCGKRLKAITEKGGIADAPVVKELTGGCDAGLHRI